MIPYGRQFIDEDDIKAVTEVLRSDWLTTGPKVAEFEQAVADYVDAKYAVAISSGTAALHAAMYAIGIGPGDEVIVPPITFAASANCIVFQGGTPVFSDVESDTLLIDPGKIDLLEKIATTDPDSVVRKHAIGKITDVEILEQIANDDSDESIKIYVLNRLNPIYREMLFSSEDYETRKSFLDKVNDLSGDVFFGRLFDPFETG